MGQSNSTSPIVPQKNQISFNYSRLISYEQYIQKQQNKRKKQIQLNKKQNNQNKYKSNLKQPNFNNLNSQNQIQKIGKQNNFYIFAIDKFQSLDTDDLLVKNRQDRMKIYGDQDDIKENQQNITQSSNLLNPIKSKQSLTNLQLLNNSLNKLTKQTSQINNGSNQNLNKQNLLIPNSDNHQIHSTSRKSSYLNVKFKIEKQRMPANKYIICKTKYQNQQSNKIKIVNYFLDQEDMQSYISNLIKIKQILTANNHKTQIEATYNLPTVNRLSSINKNKQTFIKIYQDFTILTDEPLFIVQRTYPSGLQLENKISLYQLKTDLKMFFDLLCFLCKFYQRIDHVIIDPRDIYLQLGQFYVLDFKYFKLDLYEIILATIQWIFINSEEIGQTKTIYQIINQKKDRYQNFLSLPPYIKQLWNSLVTKRIKRYQIVQYVNRLRLKVISLNNNIDSFHACINFKKTAVFIQDNYSWILAKKFNEIYFYNIDDFHTCQVKIVRKKKKVDLSNIKLIFDPQQLSIKYVPQNSKLMLVASQFQLQKFSSMSDIQICYKLPVKFKYPYVFLEPKKNEIFILQYALYRYSIGDNKLYQETKKLSECIYLAKNHQYNYMIIRNSIDIFKNGIRLLIDHKQVQLIFVSQKRIFEQLSTIRIDLKNVEFCKQIYRGVYLMLAHKNLWILDINFNVFYSYATTQRIKSFYGFGKISHEIQEQYAFQIFNQPFKVDFLSHQQGLNVKIKNDNLHIIGQISGNIYYLKYLFIPQAGSLKLIDYKPLVGKQDKKSKNNSKDTNNNKQNQQNKKQVKQVKQKKQKKVKVKIIEPSQNQTQFDSNFSISNKDNQKKVSQQEDYSKDQQKIRALEMLKRLYKTAVPKWDKFTEQGYRKYNFNFHQQHLQNYKHQKWMYFDSNLFIIPIDFNLKSNKSNYEVQLLIPPTNSSFKQLIEPNKNIKTSTKIQKFKRQQILFYFHRILVIFQYLFHNHFTHKNLSINNIYFDQNNIIKLIGWSQPPRNWYVSDYKDLLLVFFNILTKSTVQKLNQKTLQKYQRQIKNFSQFIYQKMTSAFRNAKNIQKRSQIQRQITQIKDFILNQVTKRFLHSQSILGTTTIQKKQKNQEPSVINQQNYCSNQLVQHQYIFNFQINTHRVSVISIYKNKMKKIKCILDENSKEQLIFQSTDKQIWNQSKGVLYIFTTTYKFYQIKVNVQNFKEQTVICQEYQYLPNNILDASFILVANWGIYSVGGIYKSKESQIIYNKNIYKFNDQKLTWQIIGQIPEPMMNPQMIVAVDNSQIYCLGGQIKLQNSKVRITIIKLKDKNFSNTSQGYEFFNVIDPTYKNPLKQTLSNYPIKMYHLSKQYNLFLLFYITNDKYFLRIFSLSSFTMDILLETKNFTDQNKNISSFVGISLNKGILHVLRQYGKLTKVIINKLQSLSLNHQTIYPQRGGQEVKN